MVTSIQDELREIASQLEEVVDTATGVSGSLAKRSIERLRNLADEIDGKPAITTADGKAVHEGDRVFNYYDCKWGTIKPGSLDPEGWFDVNHDDGTVACLNGERISTVNPRS